MSALQVAQRYFDAWNQRDAAAITATFAPGGTYSDPVTGHALSGEAIAAYAAGLWTAFPDLLFEIISAADTGNGLIAAQWVMRGTNAGPFRGLPPTGRCIAVPGADFIAVEREGIRAVRGYFDTRGVPEQLGLQVVVQPCTVGPFEFGTSTAARSGKSSKPGAFSITALELRSEDEIQQVRELSRAITAELLAMPGFIAWVGMTIGRRMMTVTAWETVEASQQLLRGGAHAQAMRRFFGPGLAAGGMTSVWIPHRINPLWVRCRACARMVDSPGAKGTCECGASLPEPMSYW